MRYEDVIFYHTFIIYHYWILIATMGYHTKKFFVKVQKGFHLILFIMYEINILFVNLMSYSEPVQSNIHTCQSLKSPD